MSEGGRVEGKGRRKREGEGALNNTHSSVCKFPFSLNQQNCLLSPHEYPHRTTFTVWGLLMASSHLLTGLLCLGPVLALSWACLEPALGLPWVCPL